jgi:hypothetical protein
MAAWLRISRERLSATRTRDADERENWPSMDVAWQDATSSLEVERCALEQAILDFPEERLFEKGTGHRTTDFLRLAPWRHPTFGLPPADRSLC